MATLHHLLSPARSHRRFQPKTPRRAAVLSAALAGALLWTAAPASAGNAQSDHDSAAAQVAAIQARVTEAHDKLERMTLEAEAASGAALKAQAEMEAARAKADAAAAELAATTGLVNQTRGVVAGLGRQAYMGGESRYGDLQLVLNAHSPTEVLQQAATMDRLGANRTQQLKQLSDLQSRQARVETEARQAQADRDNAAHAAADAEAAANAQLSAAQADFDALSTEKNTLDEQLRQAEIRVLQEQGARDAAAQWERRQQAEAAASSMTAPAPAAGTGPASPAPAAGTGPASAAPVAGGAVPPTTGRITSCYGTRWGTLHAGVDIAAPIGTPIYAPEGGTVVAAGPASGFGLAVAIRHGDGTITLYGHVNQFFVTKGQTVSRGQQIAEVGNRGQSTGPHLHFEVHTGGLYVNRINPVPWMQARGIPTGNCG